MRSKKQSWMPNWDNSKNADLVLNWPIIRLTKLLFFRARAMLWKWGTHVYPRMSKGYLQPLVVNCFRSVRWFILVFWSSAHWVGQVHEIRNPNMSTETVHIYIIGCINDCWKRPENRSVWRDQRCVRVKDVLCTEVSHLLPKLNRRDTVKFNEYVTIAVNRNLSNCENSPEKNVSRGFNGIRSRGLCVSAAVLSQLSYEDPYAGGWPIYVWVISLDQSPWFMVPWRDAVRLQH